jgi:hypothetical protein
LRYSRDGNPENYSARGPIIGNGTTDVTLYNSLFANNGQRNPLIGGSKDPGLNFELVNNVIYNYGAFGTVISSNSEVRANMINNIYITGPTTIKDRYSIQINQNTNLFVRGNISNKRPNNNLPDWDAVGIANAPFTLKASGSSQVLTPFNFPLKNVSVANPYNLTNAVLEQAGAFSKDNVDLRIAQEVKNQRGKIISSPSEVGGYPQLNSGTPYVDSDKDGIADNWESQNGLDPSDPKDANLDPNQDGYTNLEVFLHDLTQN